MTLFVVALEQITINYVPDLNHLSLRYVRMSTATLIRIVLLITYVCTRYILTRHNGHFDDDEALKTDKTSA